MSKTIEEKARAYDKALEKAREYWETDDDNTLDIKARGTMEYLFPELRESEDEKIRKRIIQAIKIREKEMNEEWSNEIAWLEKQGKQKEYTFKSIPRLLDMIEPSDKAKAYCQKLIDTLTEEGYNTDAKIVKEVLKGWNGEDVPMAVMDKQKSINKIQPKFKVGDWVMLDRPVLITKVEDMPCNTHQYWTSDGTWFADSAKSKLWTIQDAKDGDVLCSRQIILLFKNWEYDSDWNFVIAYAGIDISGKLQITDEHWLISNETKLATKEQRELLFQKMKEAGYEWDSKNKMLNKIHIIDEDKAEMDYCFTKMMNGEKVSEEDEEYNGEDYGIDSLYHAQRILEKTLGSVDGYQTDDGILSHKCAITAIKKLYKQKAKEWSDEDERMFDYALDMIEWYSGKNGDKSKLVSDWLKSLKDKVQPKQEWSEEDEWKFSDILALLRGGENCHYNTPDLFDWLKSLKDKVQPQNWTKEDKERYISCFQRLSTGNPEQPETINSKWFKEHVYPQKQWKPSDEQMRAFEQMYNWYNNHSAQSLALNSLYNDLKKLKGE